MAESTREVPKDGGHPSRRDRPSSASTRRHFVFGAAMAAVTVGCRPQASGSAGPESPHVPAAGTAGDVAPDIQAVREHRLPIEAPPSFVFTTRFKDVP